MILDRARYAEMFAYLPPAAASLRYAESWAVRLAGIGCAAGIVLRREGARRAAIGLELFTLATLWWKHPAPAIEAVAGGRLPADFLPLLRWFLLGGDALLAAAALYALTRPSVRERFARS